MPKIVYHDSEGVEKSVELGTEPILIGRSTECQIQTQDGLVSRRHARIVYDGLYWIEDLGSANGVYVSSQKVQRSQLRPGDEALCGSLSLRFEADVAAAIRRTQGLAAVTDDMLASRATPLRPVEGSVSVPSDGTTRARWPDPTPVMAAIPSPPSPSVVIAPEASLPGPPPLPVAAPVAAVASAVFTAPPLTEAQPPPPPPVVPVGGDEVERARLQRKVEQAQSELRRKFGEAAVSQAAPDPRVAELEDKVRRLEAERDEALRRAAAAAAAVPKEAPAADPRLAEELERARRQIDQLQAEARRRAGGTVTSAPSGDLEAALRQLRDVERERDSLRGMVAQGGGPARVPSRVLECLNAVGDGLADMRAALKAAGDELAVEQLEQARGNLKEILSLLGPR